MGRKVDLQNLTEEEKSRILKVIQRDFDLRKNEAKRIGHLNDVIKEETRESNPSKCITCGSTFIWLFHPKMQCKICSCFFCKNNDSCGNYDSSDDTGFCLFCYSKRQTHLMTLDWFYSQLKSKFRRHGGAKIVREFYKKKVTGVPPTKPPRLQETDAQTDLTDQTEIKTQIEEALAAVLIPKLDELKASQPSSGGAEEYVRTIEEILDRFLHQNAQREVIKESDDDLMWRYLKDHKQSVVMRIMKGLAEKSPSGDSVNGLFSTTRNAETMTEASDSDMESLLSASGSLRSRPSSSQLAPLSERISTISAESMNKAIRASQVSGTEQRVVQGVVRKDEILARADVDATMAEILEEQDRESSQAQEFSTELKFTAIDVTTALEQNFRRNSSASESGSDDANDAIDDNWTIQTNFRRSIKMPGAYMPSTDVPSAYEHAKDQMLCKSDDDFDTCVAEADVQPVNVRKEFPEISRSYSNSDSGIDFSNSSRKSPSIRNMPGDEISDYLSQELDINRPRQKKQAKILTGVVEEKVIPLKKKREFNNFENTLDLQRNRKPSQDSACFSDVSRSRMSDSSSIDGSVSKTRSKLLVPQRFVNVKRSTSPRQIELDENTELMKEDLSQDFDIFGRFRENKESSQSSDQSETCDEADNSSQVDVKIEDSNTGDNSITRDDDNDVKSNPSEDDDEIRDSTTLIDETPDTSGDEMITNKKLETTYQTEDCVTNNDENNSTLMSELTIDDSLEEIQSIQRKSFDQRLQDLRDAGLQVDKTKFKRSSLIVQSTEVPQNVNITGNELVSDVRDITKYPEKNQTLDVHGFIVDSATYKKKQEEISLRSSISSENESVSSQNAKPTEEMYEKQSNNVTTVPTVPVARPRVNIFGSNVKTTTDISVNLENVDKVSNNSNSDSDASSVTYEKSGYDADMSIMTSENESVISHSDISSASKYDQFQSKEDMSSLPSVAQRRSLFFGEKTDATNFGVNEKPVIIASHRPSITSHMKQCNEEQSTTTTVDASDTDVSSLLSDIESKNTTLLKTKVYSELSECRPNKANVSRTFVQGFVGLEKNKKSSNLSNSSSYSRLTTSASSITSSSKDDVDSDCISMENEKFTIVCDKPSMQSGDEVISTPVAEIISKNAGRSIADEIAVSNKNLHATNDQFNRLTPMRGSLTMRGSSCAPKKEQQQSSGNPSDKRRTLFSLKL